VGENCTSIYYGYWYCVRIQPQTSMSSNTTATSLWYPSWTYSDPAAMNTTLLWLVPPRLGLPPIVKNIIPPKMYVLYLLAYDIPSNLRSGRHLRKHRVLHWLLNRRAIYRIDYYNYQWTSCGCIGDKYIVVFGQMSVLASRIQSLQHSSMPINRDR
jgi:hypothetical protein